MYAYISSKIFTHYICIIYTHMNVYIIPHTQIHTHTHTHTHMVKEDGQNVVVGIMLK